MPSEKDTKKRIKDVYYGEEKRGRPANRVYLGILIIVGLIAVLYVMVSTPQGTVFLQSVTKSEGPKTTTEANKVANDFGRSLDDASSIISDLSTSLGG